MIASSVSASISIMWVRCSVARSTRSSGTGVSRHSTPMSSSYMYATMRTRSTMPRNWSSAPTGICSGSGRACSRSIMVWTPRAKSAPMRSILLMNAMRGTRYLSACRHTVSDWGSTPGHRVEQRDGAVEHPQRPFDLHSEVHVAGCVYDVDEMAVPFAGRRSRRDGDAALLLLLHPIHDGSPVVHLADLVGPAGVVQDALGGRRLAGIDVRHDADVARPLERELPLLAAIRLVRSRLCHSPLSLHSFSLLPHAPGSPAAQRTGPGHGSLSAPAARTLSHALSSRDPHRGHVEKRSPPTSGSGRRPCWPRPYGAGLPSSSS